MTEKINKDMTFGELMQSFPQTVQILAGFGLHCIGCHLAVTETIEQGARAHGLNEIQIGQMIDKLNNAV